MEKILIAAIIILFATSANAQIGMPKELTCTEEAFNFSFSLGTKWKLSVPKMGPVEVIENRPEYIPAQSFKANYITPGTHLPPLFAMPFSAGYAINQQNYVLVSYPDSLKAMDKPKYLFPGINFSFPTDYTILKPGFLVNLNQQFVY